MLQHSTQDSLPALDPIEYSCPALPFLASATLWLGAIFAISHAGSMEVLSVGASMLLLGAPVWLAGVYTSTLHRQFQLVFFHERGWLYRLLSRRLFIQVFWTFCALVTAFVLLVRFQVYDLLQWAVLAATVPVFALVFGAIHRVLAKELRSDVAVTKALVWSRRSCPALMLLLYVGVLASWGDVPVYASLQEAFEAQRGSAAVWNGSALVGHALHWGAYFDGLEAYALGHLGRVDPLWAFLAMGAGNLAIFYSVSFALSAFRITRAGFRQARLVPRSRGAIFATTGVTVFLVAFVYFPLLANLNQWLASSTEPTDVLDEVEEGTTTLVEILGGDPYQTGTAEEIKRARAEALMQIGAQTERFRREVDAAFDRLETEAVGEYLDWYYSLPAEYGRLVQMFMGSLEEHLADKWREVIEQEEWFREVDAAREELVSVSEEVWAAYQGRVVEILDRNRLDSEHAPFEITLETSLEAIVQPLLDHQDIITAPTRLGLGGMAGAGITVGGGIAAVIGQKVTAKVLAEQVLKVAAKAPLKAAAGKMAGATASGSAAGALIGSIVPGAGTLVGALVGGVIVGIGVGVGIDAALLKAEEALSRDDFERALVTAIREARSELANEDLGEPAENTSAGESVAGPSVVPSDRSP